MSSSFGPGVISIDDKIKTLDWKIDTIQNILFQQQATLNRMEKLVQEINKRLKIKDLNSSQP